MGAISSLYINSVSDDNHFGDFWKWLLSKMVNNILYVC